MPNISAQQPASPLIDKDEGKHLKKGIAIIWLLCCVLYIYLTWDKITTLQNWGQDDFLRLVQMRDWLAGQSWFDTTQYRIAPPEGVSVHWNRLVDAPLALVILLCAPLTGHAMAEQIAMTIVPLFTMLVMLVAIAYCCKTLFGRTKVAAYAMVLAVICIPIKMQMNPLRIDHHGWQIALCAIALYALVAPNNRRNAMLMGVSLALLTSISLEGLPLAVSLFAAAALPWFFTGQKDSKFITALWVYALSSIALYLLTRGFAPPGGCDILRAIPFCRHHRRCRHFHHYSSYQSPPIMAAIFGRSHCRTGGHCRIIWRESFMPDRG